MTEKLQYQAPMLVEIGSIHDLTLAAANQDNPDFSLGQLTTTSVESS